MSTRFYPLYQRGNPQLRIFLPNFFMKLIKPAEPTPPNIVQFMTSVEMTHHDVKNYLEKIYKVPVVEVKVEIKTGDFIQCPEKRHITKADDYKIATVTMPKHIRFEFPDILPQTSEREKAKDQMKSLKEAEVNAKKKNIHKPFLPTWF